MLRLHSHPNEVQTVQYKTWSRLTRANFFKRLSNLLRFRRNEWKFARRSRAIDSARARKMRTRPHKPHIPSSLSLFHRCVCWTAQTLTDPSVSHNWPHRKACKFCVEFPSENAPQRFTRPTNRHQQPISTSTTTFLCSNTFHLSPSLSFLSIY